MKDRFVELLLVLVLLLQGCAFRLQSGHQVWPPLRTPADAPAPVAGREQQVTVAADARLPGDWVQDRLGADLARGLAEIGTLSVWVKVHNGRPGPVVLRSGEIALELADGRRVTPETLAVRLPAARRAVQAEEMLAPRDQSSAAPEAPSQTEPQQTDGTPAADSPLEPEAQPQEAREAPRAPSRAVKVVKTGAEIVGGIVVLIAGIAYNITVGPIVTLAAVATSPITFPTAFLSSWHNHAVEKRMGRDSSFATLNDVELPPDTEVASVMHFGIDGAPKEMPVGTALLVPLIDKDQRIIVRVPL